MGRRLRSRISEGTRRGPQTCIGGFTSYSSILRTHNYLFPASPGSRRREDRRWEASGLASPPAKVECWPLADGISCRGGSLARFSSYGLVALFGQFWWRDRLQRSTLLPPVVCDSGRTPLIPFVHQPGAAIDSLVRPKWYVAHFGLMFQHTSHIQGPMGSNSIAHDLLLSFKSS